MTNVWCVRAEFGRYAEHFVRGEYVGIGWLPDVDLSGVRAREELYPLYRQAYPHDTSSVVIGQQVGQIARFHSDMRTGDYVITPAADSERLHYGQVGRTPTTTARRPKTAACAHLPCASWAHGPLRYS